ncbi:MAG: hypothetical protein ACRDA4_10030 [Filifactoraceae bacterium]
MKKTLSRILAIPIALALVATSLPMQIFAYKDANGNEVKTLPDEEEGYAYRYALRGFYWNVTSADKGVTWANNIAPITGKGTIRRQNHNLTKVSYEWLKSNNLIAEGAAYQDGLVFTQPMFKDLPDYVASQIDTNAFGVDVYSFFSDISGDIGKGRKLSGGVGTIGEWQDIIRTRDKVGGVYISSDNLDDSVDSETMISSLVHGKQILDTDSKTNTTSYRYSTKNITVSSIAKKGEPPKSALSLNLKATTETNNSGRPYILPGTNTQINPTPRGYGMDLVTTVGKDNENMIRKLMEEGTTLNKMIAENVWALAPELSGMDQLAVKSTIQNYINQGQTDIARKLAQAVSLGVAKAINTYNEDEVPNKDLYNELYAYRITFPMTDEERASVVAWFMFGDKNMAMPEDALATLKTALDKNKYGSGNSLDVGKFLADHGVNYYKNSSATNDWEKYNLHLNKDIDTALVSGTLSESEVLVMRAIKESVDTSFARYGGQWSTHDESGLSGVEGGGKFYGVATVVGPDGRERTELHELKEVNGLWEATGPIIPDKYQPKTINKFLVQDIGDLFNSGDDELMKIIEDTISIVERPKIYNTRNRAYRTFIPIIVRVRYVEKLDLKASRMEATQALTPRQSTITVTSCGKVNEGKLQSDITTTSRVTSTSTVPTDGNIDEVKNQLIKQNRDETCITTTHRVDRGERPKVITFNYKVNESEKKPEDEATYDNNYKRISVVVPEIKIPDFIAEKVTGTTTVVTQPTSPTDSAVVRVCVSGVGTADNLDGPTDTTHRLLIDNSPVITGPTRVDNDERVNLGEQCKTYTVSSTTSSFKACYEINPNRNPEESNYTNNIVCKDLPVNIIIPTNPTKPTPLVGCGGYLLNKVNAATGKTYNKSTKTGEFRGGLQPKTNYHFGAVAYPSGDTQVAKMPESKFKPEKYPEAYIWYDTLQAKPQSKGKMDMAYFTPTSKNPNWYYYPQTKSSPASTMLTIATSTTGQCGMPRTSTTGIGGTTIPDPGCGGPQEKCCYKGHYETYRYEECTTDRYGREKCKTKTGKEWVCDQYRTYCTDPNVSVWYVSGVMQEFNALAYIEPPRLSTFDGMTKLDAKNSIKSGYGFKVENTYEVATDWDGEIKEKPFMVRPEKEATLWENYSSTYSNPAIDGGMDGIGIQNGGVNNAYVGLGRLGPGGNRTYPDSYKGYNRISYKAN